MIKIWSELRVARVKEQVADVATLLWVVLSGTMAWRMFQFLASYTEAGRTVRTGGETTSQSGRDLGDSLVENLIREQRHWDSSSTKPLTRSAHCGALPLWQRSARSVTQSARRDEAGLVCDHDQLGAITRRELAKDPTHMRLRRGRADHEPVGDLVV